MKCEFCDNPATVHITKLTGGINPAAKHLCDDCAKKHQVIVNPNELNLPALVHLMLGSNLDQISEELSRLTCPHCGIKYMEFRGEGRLGCPNDYELFRAGLEPIFRRIHRADRHRGKSPPHRLTNQSRQAEMFELHHQLRRAVDSEQFEEASRLRDAIRQKETADEPG
jgi:protein arginine kinase activator